MTRRITVDARMLRQSGIGTYLSALLPRLVARLPDVRITLLVPPGEPGVDGCERVPLSAGVYSPLEQPALLRAIPADTDLMWSPHINIPAGWGGRLLVTVHDVFYLEPEWSRTVRVDKRVYVAAMMRMLARRASAVLAVSAFTADSLRRLLPALQAPVIVVPNGVDGAWLQPVTACAPHPRPYVVAVGNVKPHKNLSLLIRAFALLEDRMEHDLVIVGRSDGFAGGTGLDPAFIERLGARLHFTGHVPFEELRAWVFHADLMAFVSLYEGFGLPPLEAMACGTPVLASRAASIPEACGEAAAYCDAHNVTDVATELSRLLADGAAREELAEAGRRRVTGFDWDTAADKTAQVIRTLL